MNPDELSEEHLRAYLVGRIARATNLAGPEIGPDDTLQSLGLSSRNAATIAGDLAALLGFRLPETLLYDYPTIAELARVLARAAREGGLPEEKLGE